MSSESEEKTEEESSSFEIPMNKEVLGYIEESNKNMNVLKGQILYYQDKAEQYEKLLKYLMEELQVPNTNDINTMKIEISRSISKLKLNHCQNKVTNSPKNCGREENKINISKPLNDDNILEEELNKLERENSYLKLQFDTLAEDISRNNDSATKNKISTIKTFILETDLNVAQQKCGQLEKDREKLKSKIKVLRTKNGELQKSCDDHINEIQILHAELSKMQTTETEKEKMGVEKRVEESTNLQNLQIVKNNELRALHEALDIITGQVSELSIDLSNENKSRNKVVILMHRQSLALQQAEQALVQMRNDYLKQKNECDTLTKNIERMENQLIEFRTNESETIEFLRSNNLYRESESFSELIISTIRHLLKNSKNETSKITVESDSQMSQQNKRLTVLLRSTLRFLNQIANSEEIQSWALKDSPPENFRNKLNSELARISSFISCNHLDTQPSDLQVSEFTNLPLQLQQMIDESKLSNDDGSSESSVIIETLIMANSTIVTYCNELQTRGQIIMNDLKRARNEIEICEQRSSEETLGRTIELESKLEDAGQKIQQYNSILSQIQMLLRKESIEGGDSNETVAECLKIISDPEKNQPQLKCDKDLENNYIYSIEEQLANTTSKLKETESALSQKIEESQKIIEELNSQIEELQKENEDARSDLEAQISYLKQDLDEITSKNKSMESIIKDADTENNRKEILIENLQCDVNDLKEELQNQKLEYEKQIKEKLDNQKKRHEQDLLKADEELQNADEEFKRTVRAMRKYFKGELKKAKQEIEVQNARVNEIREHYEPIIGELRTKMTELRISEDKAKSQLEKSIVDNKSLQSENQGLRVDLQVSRMKLKSLEEKAKRDKSLIETKVQMKVLSIDTEKVASIEKAKIDYENRIAELSRHICEALDDELEEYNEKSALDSVDKARKLISSQKVKIEKLTNMTSELKEIRNILGIDKHSSLIDNVRVFLGERDSLLKSKSQIIEDKRSASIYLKNAKLAAFSVSELKAWDDWSKRLYITVSECFHISKGSSEIRNYLEEFIISALGLKNHMRKLETLRAEKEILTSGCLRAIRNKPDNILLQALIRIVTGISRIQRASGHLRCSISLPVVQESERPSNTTKKNWPVFAML